MEGHVVDLRYNVYTRELQLALAFRSFLSAFASQRRQWSTLSTTGYLNESVSVLPLANPGPSSFPSASSFVSCTPGESTDLFKRRSRREAAGFVTAGESRSILRIPNFHLNFHFKFLSLFTCQFMFLVIHINFLYLVRHSNIRIMNKSTNYI